MLAVGHGIINKAVQAVYYNCDMKDVTRMTNAEVRLLELAHDFIPSSALQPDGPSVTQNDNKFCIT